MGTPTTTVAEMVLHQEDLPDLFERADRGAMDSRKWHFRLLRLDLILIVLAPATVVLSHYLGPLATSASHFHVDAIHFFSFTIDGKIVTDAIALYAIPALVMVCLLLVMYARTRLKRDEQWRKRRALAEDVASLAWRYSMGALPSDLPKASALTFSDGRNGTYQQEYTRLIEQAEPLDLPPVVQQRGPISRKMQTVRDSHDIAGKLDAYRTGRIQDQIGFYTKRIDRYHGRRNLLRRLTIAAYVIGVLLLPINGLGVMTTAAGAIAAWLTANHYDDLYQSFDSMKSLLQLKQAEAGEVLRGDNDSEDAARLALFVDNVENLLEGEHSSWLVQTAR